MKERVPDSSGLPLRAMVMVLLFLGVIFLLLGWQAIGSSGNSDDDSASPVSNSVTSSTSSTSGASATSTSSKPGPIDAEVHVFNISGKEGVAAHTADQLKGAGFKVIDIGNLSLADVSVKTAIIKINEVLSSDASARASFFIIITFSRFDLNGKLRVYR